MVRLLLDAGADLSLENEDNDTALTVKMKHKYRAKIRKLLREAVPKDE